MADNSNRHACEPMCPVRHTFDSFARSHDAAAFGSACSFQAVFLRLKIKAPTPRATSTVRDGSGMIVM